MSIEVIRIPIDDKPVLRRLMELYLYDFSKFDQADVNQHGLYEYDFIDPYWTEPERHPFFIRVGGKLAGFALVRITRYSSGRPLHNLAEFFVMRKYRRQGVGHAAAKNIFAQFPGLWHVAQEEANVPAQVFWKKVIQEYTGSNFRQVVVEGWHGPVLEFESG
jgi:predicted acetyltransferase